MKKHLFFLFLLSFSFRAFGICAQLLRSVQAPVVEGRGSYILSKGEIYPAVGKNKERTHYTLQLGKEKVIVSKDAVKLMKGEICGKKSAAIEKPTPPPPPTEEPSPAPPPPVEKKAATTTTPPATPPPPSETEPPAVAEADSVEKPNSVRWGVEAGGAMNLSSDDYSGLVTYVPDPTDVGGLQDPLITEVKKGSGFFVRVFKEKDLTPVLRTQLGLGYLHKTFTYAAKSNPSTGAVRLEDLTGYEEKFEASQLELGFGASFVHHSRAWQFGAGGRLDLKYHLSGKQKIDVLKASGGFKNTAATVEDGPDAFGYLVKGTLDAQYKSARLTLGVDQDAAFFLTLSVLF